MVLNGASCTMSIGLEKPTVLPSNDFHHILTRSAAGTQNFSNLNFMLKTVPCTERDTCIVYTHELFVYLQNYIL